MLRRLRHWLVKRLGGYTFTDMSRNHLKGWNAALRHVHQSRSTRVNQSWRDMEEMSDYLNQHHDAGFELGFSQGMISERRAHSCDEAYQDGFEDALSLYEDLLIAWEHTDMSPDIFVAAFRELRNG